MGISRRTVAGLSIALTTCLLPEGTARGQSLPAVAGLDEFMPVPVDNPLRPRVIELGRRLFFDTRLSRDGSLSCASCHLPALGFADTAERSRGIAGRTGHRNSPALINRAWGTSFFWDGRVTSLEQQVLRPIEDSSELGLSTLEAAARLAADSGYVDAFRQAFGTRPDTVSLAKALASYLRVIRSGDSRVDRFRGGDPTVLSASEQRGMALFAGAARCSRCHVGRDFTDEDFHNTGVSAPSADPGRERVTGLSSDRGKFKTPTLRDVARTAPYMHDGSLTTLEAVIEFYNRGGGANPHVDREVRPLGLSTDNKADLANFLRALTSRTISCAPTRCAP